MICVDGLAIMLAEVEWRYNGKSIAVELPRPMIGMMAVMFHHGMVRLANATIAPRIPSWLSLLPSGLKVRLPSFSAGREGAAVAVSGPGCSCWIFPERGIRASGGVTAAMVAGWG